MSSTNIAKKNKGKKVADPNETSKLLAAKISQLEQDAAGEKDQEQEIGAFCPVFEVHAVLVDLRALHAPVLSQDIVVTNRVQIYRARGEEGYSRSQPAAQQY